MQKLKKWSLHFSNLEFNQDKGLEVCFGAGVFVLVTVWQERNGKTQAQRALINYLFKVTKLQVTPNLVIFPQY